MRWTEDRRKVEIVRSRNVKQQAMRDVTSRQRSREYALFYYCSVVSLRSDIYYSEQSDETRWDLRDTLL